MQNTNELIYQIALTKLPHVGVITGKKLLHYFGNVRDIFEASTKEILVLQGIQSRLKKSFEEREKWLEFAEREIEFITAQHIKTVFITEEQYPFRLKANKDSPLMLYVRGRMDFNGPKFVGMVGTRNPSSYGKQMVRNILEGFQERAITVISGLAFGVDIEVHKACLDLGIPTIGVMGSSFDLIYPDIHMPVAKQMMQGDNTVMTEYTSGSKPDRENFPMRNRIIAGMVDALVVVESKETGGSMITASMADGYNRTVFAVPGRSMDANSRGCNYLIKTRKAELIQSAEDLIYEMEWGQASRKSVQLSLFQELNEEERLIFNLIQREQVITLDELSDLTEMSPSILANHLLQMEFRGLLISRPGKRYELV
jgi:DNA processing protein